MTPTGNIGWKPRYSPDGLRVTWEQPGYWQAQWFNETKEIAQNGTVLVFGAFPGIVTNIPGANELSAGGGVWAAFRTDPVRVYTNLLPDPIPGAGCPVVNPDGVWGYVDSYLSDFKHLIFGGLTVGAGAITDVRASRQAIVWSDAGRTWGMRLDRPDHASDIQAAPREFRPIPIDVPGGAWVGNHTDTGLVVRPFGSVMGYRFDNGGQAFYPDWKYDAAVNAIVAIFTNDQGVQFERVFYLDAPRVDLSLPVPPNPEPPEPEPPVSQPLPPLVKDTRDRFVAAFPVPHIVTGETLAAFEDRCRDWCWELAEQVHFDTRDPRYGVKSSSPTNPQSKDALAFNTPPLIAWDLLLGVGTGAPTLVADPQSVSIPDQTFIPVPAVDHLEDTPVPPTPEPGPLPPGVYPITYPPGYVPPKDLNDWIHGEFPKLAAAYKSTHGGNDPTYEWAAFQTCRRYGAGLPQGEPAWTFEAMMKHELSQ